MRRIAANKPLTKSSPRRRGSISFGIIWFPASGNDKTVLNQSFTRSAKQRLAPGAGRCCCLYWRFSSLVLARCSIPFLASSDSTVERDKITAAALAQAKAA